MDIRLHARAFGLVMIITAAEIAPMMEAIEFWRSHGGSAGIWWAVAMPVVALFLWFQLTGRQRWAVGGLASLTLLAAPLWQVAAPVLEAQGKAPAMVNARQVRIRMLQAQIAEGTHKAQVYVENSSARAGWLPAIQANDKALQNARNELDTLLLHPVTADNGWLSWAVAVIQALSLVLMHTASVIAIRHLGPLLETLTVTGKGHTKQQDNGTRNATETPLPSKTVTPPMSVTVNTIPAQRGTVEIIYQRLVDGVYGTNPIGRRIREIEKVAYDVVKQAIGLAQENGYLIRTGQGFELVPREEA